MTATKDNPLSLGGCSIVTLEFFTDDRLPELSKSNIISL